MNRLRLIDEVSVYLQDCSNCDITLLYKKTDKLIMCNNNKSMDSLRIGTWNLCLGLSNKKEMITDYLKSKKHKHLLSSRNRHYNELSRGHFKLWQFLT